MKDNTFKTLVFGFYYLYALAVIAGSAYIVFWKGHSGLWFIVTLLLLDKSPKFKTSK